MMQENKPGQCDDMTCFYCDEKLGREDLEIHIQIVHGNVPIKSKEDTLKENQNVELIKQKQKTVFGKGKVTLPDFPSPLLFGLAKKDGSQQQGLQLTEPALQIPADGRTQGSGQGMEIITQEPCPGTSRDAKIATPAQQPPAPGNVSMAKRQVSSSMANINSPIAQEEIMQRITLQQEKQKLQKLFAKIRLATTFPEVEKHFDEETELLLTKFSNMCRQKKPMTYTWDMGIDMNFQEAMYHKLQTEFRVVYAKSDGNCFYDAISTATFGHSEYAAHFRMLQVFHMVKERDNLQRIKPAFASTGTLEDLLGSTKQLALATTEGWATEWNIFIMSELLKRPIYVHQPSRLGSQRPGYNSVYTSNPAGAERTPIHLILKGKHFEPIVPLNQVSDFPNAVGNVANEYQQIQWKYTLPLNFAVVVTDRNLQDLEEAGHDKDLEILYQGKTTIQSKATPVDNKKALIKPKSKKMKDSKIPLEIKIPIENKTELMEIIDFPSEHEEKSNATPLVVVKNQPQALGSKELSMLEEEIQELSLSKEICGQCKKPELTKNLRHLGSSVPATALSTENRELHTAIQFLQENGVSVVSVGYVCRPCKTRLLQWSENLKARSSALVKIRQRNPNGGIFGQIVTSQVGKCLHCNAPKQKLPQHSRLTTHLGKNKATRQTTIIQAIDFIRNNLKLDPIEILPESTSICKTCREDVESIYSSWNKELEVERELQKSKASPSTRKLNEPTGVTPSTKKFKSRQGKTRNSDLSADSIIQSPRQATALVQLNEDDKRIVHRLMEVEIADIIQNSHWKTTLESNIPDLINVQLNEMATFIKTKCPTLSLIFPQNQDGSPQIGPKEVMAMSILCNSRNSRFNALQKALAFECFRSLSKNQMAVLNKLGVTTSRKTAYNVADAINQMNKEKLQLWKFEEAIRWCDTFGEMPLSPTPKGRRRRLQPEFDMAHSQEQRNNCSFMLQIDNMDYFLTHRHQSSEHGSSSMVHETAGFFIKSRIPYASRSMAVKNKPTSLPLSTFTLSYSDSELLFLEKVELFMELGIQNLEAFKNSQWNKTRTSKLFQESVKLQSDTVSIGVLPLAMNSLKGMINVVDKMIEFIPTREQHQLPFRIGGDCGAVALLYSAKSLRSSAEPEGSFDNVWPSTACCGLHQSMGILGGMYKLFGLGTTQMCEEGTLANIKETSGHKTASTNVTATYNHGYELAEATLNGLGTLLLMKHLEIGDWNEIPEGLRIGNADGLGILKTAATKAAEEIILRTRVANLSTEMLCVCTKQIKKKEAIVCGNLSCRHWLHKNCAKSIKNSQMRFCSDDCSDRVYQYSISLLDTCMKLKCRRDAYRLQEFEKIDAHTKEDLNFFIANGNKNFAKLCHHYLAAQGGCIQDHIAFDERYNSAANLRGHLNTNIEMDRLCENIVRADKTDRLSHSGKITEKSVNRRTTTAKPASQLMQDLSEQMGLGSYEGKHNPRQYMEETHDFIRRYEAKNLVKVIGPRSHKGSENFQYQTREDDSKLETRLLKMSEDLELTLKMCGNLGLDPVNEPVEYVCPVLPSGRTEWQVEYTNLEEELFIKIKDKFPNCLNPNDIQFEAAKTVGFENKDLILGLPTGFGKSYVYILATLMRNVQSEENQTVCLIVSPLLAIIRDQLKMLERLGFKGIHLQGESLPTIKKGGGLEFEESVIFMYSTPEFISKKTNRQWIMDVSPKIICVDEAHLIKEYHDTDFRSTFSELGGLRVFSKAPILAMSASFSQDSIDEACNTLHLNETCGIMLASPNRPNIFYGVKKRKQSGKFMTGIVNGLKKYGTNLPKTVIYLDTYPELNSHYRYLFDNLLVNFYNEGHVDFYSRLVHVYYQEQYEHTKRFIEGEFQKPDSKIRVVLATTSFALGVDVKDIRIACCIEAQNAKRTQRTLKRSQIIQCLGRAGRDGEPAIGLAFCESLDFDKCHRQNLHADFPSELPGVIDLDYICGHQEDCEGECGSLCMDKSCICCDHCRIKCNCQKGKRSDYADKMLPKTEQWKDVPYDDEET